MRKHYWSWIFGIILALFLLPSCGDLPIDLPDGDGDGIPDLIDPCPTNPDPTCVPGAEPGAPYDCANPPALTGLVRVKAPIPNRYIAVLKRGTKTPRGIAQLHTFAARYGVSNVRVFEKAFNGFSATITDTKSLAQLVASKDVQYVQQEGTKRINALSWGLDRIDQREGKDGKYAPLLSGVNVHAFVNDTGVSPVADFGDRLSPDCYSTIGGDCKDGHGHGTHVAGTIGGTVWGVAKQVIIHSVRFLDANGSGTDSDAITSLEWIAAYPLPAGHQGVVNASWGGSPAPAVDAAVCKVIESGKVFVAAAGNESADAYSSTPARVIQVLTVGAMDSSDAGASFTNFGPGVDLFAPGVDIESDTPSGGTAVYSGTSMATPHVVGASALYFESHRNATPAQVHDGIVAESTPDTLTGLGEGSPNRLLYVQPVGATPPPETGSPKVVDGRFVPFLRGAVNCCDYSGTPDLDEGIEDGWSLAVPSALDRIAAPGTVNLTHFRVGPFSDAAAGNLAFYSPQDKKKIRYVQSIGARWGTGPDMLPEAHTALEQAKARGIWVEVDVVDNWALATEGMNFFGDDCSVTHAAPPDRYLLWADQVVDATWDLAAMYNLGNEGFRCRPAPEWETGLRDRLVARLAYHGVARPIGNNVKLSDTRVVLDYRTYHGFEPIPVGMVDIPTMLTETDNDSHTAQEWVDLIRTTEQRGGYVAVWRGPDSWELQMAVLNLVPKLGEPWPGEPPPPTDVCPKPLASGSRVYLNDKAYGNGFDSTVRVQGDPEFCKLIHGEALNDCHLEGWPQQAACEMQLLGVTVGKAYACPVWQYTVDNGANVYPCSDDQTALASCDHFGNPVDRDDPQTPTTGDTLETLQGFEGEPKACGLQRDAHGPIAGFFTIAHGSGKVRACRPDNQESGCGPWRPFDH